MGGGDLQTLGLTGLKGLGQEVNPMKRIVVAVVVILALALGAWAVVKYVVARPTAAVPEIASLIPSDGIVAYLERVGLREDLEPLKNGAFVRRIRELEFWRSREGMKLKADIEAELEKAGITWEDVSLENLMQVFGRRFAVGFYGIDPEARHPRLVLATELEPKARLAAMLAAPPGEGWVSYTRDGCQVYQSTRLPLLLGTRHGILLAATEEKLLHSSLDLLSGGDGPSMATDETMAALREKVDMQGDASLYLVGGAFMKLFASEATGTEANTQMSELLAGTGPSLSVSDTTPTKKVWKSVTLIEPETMNPLMRSIYTAPGDRRLRLLAALPAGAPMAQAARLDLGAYVRVLLDALDPVARQELDEGLAQMEESVGLTLDDILGWMGEEVALVMGEPDAATPIPAPSLGVCILAADPEGAAALFDRVESILDDIAAAQFSAAQEMAAATGTVLPEPPKLFQDKQHGGVTSRALTVPGAPLALEYAIVDDVVVLGWGAAFESTLLALSGQAPRLEADPAWAELPAGLPEQGLTQAAYISGSALSIATEMIRSSLEMMPEKALKDENAALLRDLPVVLEAIGSAIQWVVTANYVEDDVVYQVGVARLSLL